ncbi:unnamed protein product [Sympodiomycopsis kandeliae]
MAPSLHISAGPSVAELQPLAVNHDESPLEINSPGFRGRATVRIKSFTGHDPDGIEHRNDSKYFDSEHRKGITWSIQIQGRFLEEVSSNDVVFGNQFDKPIRDHLPYGTSVALQFVKVVDPNMKHDLYADSPWAFSPFIASLTHINVQRVKSDNLQGKNTANEEFEVDGYPSFPSPETEAGKKSVASRDGWTIDNTGVLLSSNEESSKELTQSPGTESIADDSTFKSLSWPTDQYAYQARKKVFGNEKNRSQINFKSNDIFTVDFANGYIDFNTLSLAIPGMTFDLKKYWDGQPVRYVARNQSTGQVYFVVQFDIQDLDS